MVRTSRAWGLIRAQFSRFRKEAIRGALRLCEPIAEQRGLGHFRLRRGGMGGVDGGCITGEECLRQSARPGASRIFLIRRATVGHGLQPWMARMLLARCFNCKRWTSSPCGRGATQYLIGELVSCPARRRSCVGRGGRIGRPRHRLNSRGLVHARVDEHLRRHGVTRCARG